MGTTSMKRAIGWEMAATRKGVTGVRVIVAGQYILTQTTEAGNQRPRWIIEDAATGAAANQRAVAVTDYVEREHGGTLIVPPTEMVIHDAELEALARSPRIPATLRARAYTCLSRAKAADQPPRTA